MRSTSKKVIVNGGIPYANATEAADALEVTIGQMRYALINGKKIKGIYEVKYVEAFKPTPKLQRPISRLKEVLEADAPRRSKARTSISKLLLKFHGTPKN